MSTKTLFLSFMTLLPLAAAAQESAPTPVSSHNAADTATAARPETPAARRLSIGGYGEAVMTRNFYSQSFNRYNAPQRYKDDASHGRFDLPHVTLYLGYDFGHGWTLGTEIEFEHVSFSYLKKGEANIRDLSFRIEKGETLGIIGEIGSGKSTIVNLMMRMYDADEGMIRIAGRDVRSYPPEKLKEKFGVVFQNDTIFEDTIAGNVTLGREMEEQQIREALLYARASEFVEDKANKEAEALNIRGANLSGGQKQRVLIARALAAKPEILILDDSSSALDYRTDAELRRGIKEHFADTTLVIVAQRVSSIRNADHILVLEDGKPIGYGKHEELLQSCETYAEIARSQMGEGQREEAGRDVESDRGVEAVREVPVS